VVVFGGPNFPLADEEKLDFLRKRPAIDFYAELEGELGFGDLLRKLDANGGHADNLKDRGRGWRTAAISRAPG
jgi:hypothetical protein